MNKPTWFCDWIADIITDWWPWFFFSNKTEKLYPQSKTYNKLVISYA